jgi:hypothetical protein
MTPQEQRISIAEACGWTDLDKRLGDKRTNAQCDYCGIPDYLNSLDAMHEAEKLLNWEQSVNFRIFLSRNSDGHKATFNSVEAAMCHATAAQRAEAFLRTLNLYT